MLETYSPSGKELEIARLIREYMVEMDFENPIIDEKYNVVSVSGSGEPSILICGHEDTVPGFMPVKYDGDLIYGRGAVDAKSSLLSLLLGAKKARDSGFRGKIIMASASGEESDSKGINYIKNHYEKTDFAIFGEPGGAENITTGYKGRTLFEIYKKSNAHHASSSWMEENAIDSLISLWESIKTRWGDNKDFNSITAGITKFNGGEYDNMTPENASMSIDIRYPKSVEQQDVIKYMENDLKTNLRDNYSYEIKNSALPYISNIKSNLVKSFKESISSYNLKPKLIFKSGSGDMNTLGNDWKIPVITYGPGDTKLSHTSSEVVSVNEIDLCANIVSNSLLYLQKNNF